jgi:hypothetical protein
MNLGLPNIQRRKHGYRIGKHFWLYEFECPCLSKGFSLHDGYCGGAVIVDVKLVRDVLDPLRERFGPISIVNGFRCWNYHAHLYSLRDREPTKNSSHLTGEGVDLWTREPIRAKKHHDLLLDLKVTGIGSKDGRVTHIDVKHPILTTWTYS